MFAVTGIYHRYFSHKAYRTSRAGQFFLALWGGTAVQRGPRWWAYHHRHHHQHSDDETDVHSPHVHGFWWSHIGWITSRRNFSTDYNTVRDLRKFPKLIFLNRFDTVGRRRFPTDDDSRNSFILSVITLGEGWHNNHHRYPSTVRQGFYWWEIDITYYLLRLLAWTGLIWDLKSVPKSVYVEAEQTGNPGLSNHGKPPITATSAPATHGQALAQRPS